MQKRLLAVLIILVLLLGLAACGGGAQPSSSPVASVSSPSVSSPAQPSAENKRVEITVAMPATPNGFDPVSEDTWTSLSAQFLVLEHLIDLDENLNMVPQLAKTWKQVDAVTWEFEIDLSAKFHNGDQLTMDDVVFSMERIKDVPKSADLGSNIDTVTYQGNILTLKIKQENNGVLPRIMYTFGVINKKYVEEFGDEAIFTKPIGTGPYKLTEFTPGGDCVFDAWEDYHHGKRQVDRITFVSIPDATNRYIALESGQVQFVSNLSFYEYDLANKNAGIDAFVEPTNSTGLIYMQCEKPPFDNIKVRQAMYYALNREGWGELDGGRPLGQSVFYGGYPEFRPAKTRLPFDLAKAKELLAEAGYNESNPLKFTLLTHTYADPGLELYQSDLKSIGVECSIDVKEFSIYLTLEGPGDFDMGYCGIKNFGGAGITDLERVDSRYINTRNLPRYRNARCDEIIDRARVTTDPAELASIIDELNEIVERDVPWIPVLARITRWAHSKDLQGAYTRADWTVMFNDCVYTG